MTTRTRLRRASLPSGTPRLLASAPAQDRRSWGRAHTAVLALAVAHLPAALAYAVSPARPAAALVLLAALAVAVAALPRLPRRTRQWLAALALGMCPLFVLALPASDAWGYLDILLVWLAAGLYRRWGPWLLTAAVTVAGVIAVAAVDPVWAYGAGSAAGEPLRTLASQSAILVGAFLVVSLVHAATWTMLAAIRHSRAALETTRGLLSVVSVAASAARTLDEAAEPVLDALCDDTWPVAHLHLRRGDRFVGTAVWSALARAEYPAFVQETELRVPEVLTHVSPLSSAVATTRGAVWVSQTAGAAGLANLAQAMSPIRAEVAAAHGLRTVLLCPVAVDGDVVALVELYSPEAFTTEPEQVPTLSLMASLLGQVAERERHTTALAEQHQMLRAIEETVPDSIIIFDVQTRLVVMYSTGTARARDPRHALGRTLEELFASSETDFLGRTEADLMAELETGRPVLVLSPDTDGGRQPSELYYSARTVGDRELGFIFVRDVSEREKAARELATASSRAQALLEVTDAGIYELDCSGTVTFVNARGALLLGCEPADLLGTRLTDKVPFLTEEVAGALAGDAVGVVRRTGEVPRGTVRVPVAAAVTVRPGTDGLIVTLTDVTEAARGARLAARHAHALELNDTVVQGLTTAIYAIELGDADTASETLGTTLTSAKATIATLLADTPFDVTLLRRTHAAQMPASGGGRDDA